MAVVIESQTTGPSTDRTVHLAGRRLLGHALAYLVVLVALLGLTDLHHSWNLDDGAYATQVRVTDQTGGWAYPYRHRDVDPGFRYAPMSHATTTTEGAYPYAKLPAWIEVLRASTRLFGDPVGLYVPSVLGAVAAALVAGLVADRLAPGRALLGFWAVGLGPIVVHSQAMWAHTVAAALGGVACLVVLAVAERRERWWHLLAAVMTVAALVMVRNEGTLFAVALGLVLGGLQLQWTGPATKRALAAAAWAASCVGVALAVRLLMGRWSAAVAPGRRIAIAESSPGGSGFLTGRITGAARTLLDGVGGSGGGTAIAVLVVVLGVVGAVFVRRGAARSTDGWVLLGLALVLAVARTVVFAPDDLAGFLLAAPVVAMATGAWRWRSAPVGERALVALVLAHTLAVLATQYPEGGSRDWGGRFLFPVLVPALVIAALTLHRSVTTQIGERSRASSEALPQARDRAGRVGRVDQAGGPADGPVLAVGPALAGRRHLATAVVLLACALPTAGGLVAVGRARASNRDLDRLSRQVAQEVPTMVKVPRYLTRTGWSSLPAADWLSADPDTARRALTILRPGRTQPVAVVGNGADRVRASGYRRDVRSPVVVIFTPQ